MDDRPRGSSRGTELGLQAASLAHPRGSGPPSALDLLTTARSARRHATAAVSWSRRSDASADEVRATIAGPVDRAILARVDGLAGEHAWFRVASDVQ